MLLLSIIVAAIQASPSSAQSMMGKAERDEIVIVVQKRPGHGRRHAEGARQP